MNRKRIVLAALLLSAFLFNLFTYTSATEAEEMTADAKAGKLLFQKKNCIACHQLYGLGGYMGPDLTVVMSQEGKGPEYARAFIKSGSVKMPQFNFSEEEVNRLLDYLTYIDHTAVTYKQTETKRDEH